MAFFGERYGEKVKGASKTTDALVHAQIAQVIKSRNDLKKNPKRVKEMIKIFFHVSPKELERLTKKAMELLKIDVTKHKWDKEKTLIPLDKL